jgi:ATP-binding cassette subfamily B protein
MSLLQLSAELLLTLAGVAWIAPGSLTWALAIALVALLMPLALQPWVAERDLRLRSHANALHASVMDVLQGLVPVRAHRAQTAVRRLHEQQLVAWAQASRSLAITGLAAGSLQSMLCMAGASMLLWQHFMQAGQVSGADLLLVYWVLKLPAIGGRLAGLLLQLPGQRNVLSRLWEPLLAPADTSAEPSQAPTSSARGLGIEITGGRVVAAGHEILRDLQLRLQPGERVAIVGDSGAGKSTLMGLLMGWHRLAEGQMQVDGQPVGPAELAALRPLTAWVDPSVQLWNRSLMDNLHYATEPQAALPQDSRLSAVLEAADLRGVLQRLPQGLQTPLGDGGALLSGGEGQRVRLGRALMQTGVRLVLLDEPFRGLDRHQRSQLLHNALQWWHGATVLCITHDVAEARHFDRVLVMRDGSVVEDGSPAALSTHNGPYARLLAADSQVQQQWWGGDFWRRVRIIGGQVATP